MRNIIRLKDDDCALCAFRTDEEAIKIYLKWMNLLDNTLLFLGQNTSVINYKDEEEYVNKTDSSHIRFNIISAIDDKLIGNCDITLMSNHTSAMLGILIGETGYRGHGYGTKAIKLMLKFCFEELGMHRVWLNVNAENNRAIKCYEKAGFKICGTEHEVQWARGRWWDAHHMEILAQDYFRE